MPWQKEFVELNKQVHDRNSFDCREVELNDFLKTKALRHMKAGISRTMVLPALSSQTNNKFSICSFYSITVSTIKRESLPNSLAKKLPQYPIPGFLVGQLAVDKEFHGQGLGRMTLIKSLEHLWQINNHMKAYAVIVDCLNDNAQSFYAKYGFKDLYIHNGKLRMFLPMNTLEMLFK